MTEGIVSVVVLSGRNWVGNSEEAQHTLSECMRNNWGKTIGFLLLASRVLIE